MPSDRCELCGRSHVDLTRHHLIPRTRHRKRETKLEFSREQRLGSIAYLCKPCHKQIHSVLTEREMARDFNTLERLRAHPDIAKFVSWVARRPAGLHVSVSAGRRP